MVDFHRLFGVQYLLPVETIFRLLHPEARVGEHHRERRQGAKIFLVDVTQLLIVHRVGAESERQRVEDGVLVGIGRLLLVDDRTDQFAVVSHILTSGHR